MHIDAGITDMETGEISLVATVGAVGVGIIVAALSDRIKKHLKVY